MFNKCDRIAYLPDLIPDSDSVLISAKTGYGFDTLLEQIAKKLPSGLERVKLLIPYEQGGLLSQLREAGKIYSEEYLDNGIAIDALVPPVLLQSAGLKPV